MAAAFDKRRAGLSALLKNHLTTVAPKFYGEGFISDEDREQAMDETTNKSERAEYLVAVIGRKIIANNVPLKDFLAILREFGIGYLYVKIMEREAERPQTTPIIIEAASLSSGSQNVRKPQISKQRESDKVHVRVIQEVKAPAQPERSGTLHQATGGSKAANITLSGNYRPRSIKTSAGLKSKKHRLELQDLEEVKGYLQHLEMYELVRLGRELHLNYTELVRLKHTHSQPGEMVTAMMIVWLADDGGIARFPPTWRRLSAAVEKIGQIGVARKITKERINQTKN